MEKTTQPIRMSIEIPEASLKKVLEKGRLLEFVDTLSARAAAHIRAHVVAAATKGGVAASFNIGFDDDDRYGNGPRPWPHHIGLFEDAMKETAIKTIVATQK